MTTPVIKLKKAQTINLVKSNGQSMTNPYIGIGWIQNKHSQGQKFDLDVSAMMQDANGDPLGAEHFIYYHTPNYTSQCGGIEISHDNRNGTAESNVDGEWLKFFFDKINPLCEKITVCVSINDDNNGHNFGMIDNAFMRILESEGGREHSIFDLTENYPQYTGIISGVFEKRNNEWHFTAIGEGLRNGLSEFVERFNFRSES